MKTFFRLLACLVAVMLVSGCGPSKKTLDEVSMRIDSLKTQGVADSVLSGASVLLYQARTALKIGDSQKAGKNLDSALAIIDKAEKEYLRAIEELRPQIEEMRTTLQEQSAELSGLHKQTADSVLALADELIKKGWLLQAREKCAVLQGMLPEIIKSQETAEKIRKKLPGTWSSVGKGDLGVVEKRTYTFSKDGKVTTTETKKGQSTEYLKEDWAFRSWGSWDLYGDLVYIYIEREKCERQVYWNYHVKEKKWVKKEEPTYDSTLTDGAKDRVIEWDFLSQNFSKRR